jgi:phage terminase large subunit GpA-like protein
MDRPKNIIEESLACLEVSEQQKPSEWVRHRILSGYAAEPGSFRIERAPYQKDWLDSLLEGKDISFMTSAQVGKTETYTSMIGYLVDTATTPTPIMVIVPTLKMAEKFAKDRILPMFRDTPKLQPYLDLTNKNPDNTMLHKKFTGRDVTLDIVGSNSPASLASQTIRVLICDEVDKYPVLETGDAIALAEKRLQTFRNSIKILIGTPTTKGRSRIEASYLKSDQRQYFVPCPECGHEQTLVIERLVFIDNEAHYLCESCSHKIPEHHKSWMLQSGKWIAKFPKRSSTTIGFHINELYSPWSSWTVILNEKLRREGNEALLKPFYNEVLGLPYDDIETEVPAYNEFLDTRIDANDPSLMNKIVRITAACDVQKDRLEILIVGWYRRICTILDRRIIPGNPADFDDKCWDDLSELYKLRWEHPHRKQISICCIGIDSGDGNTTNSVYKWARRQDIRKVMIIKGMGLDKKLDSELGYPSDIEVNIQGKRKRLTHKIWPVNTHMLKQLIYTTLATQKEDSDSRFIFTSICDEEFFKQLTSEVLVKNTNEQGETKHSWKKIYKHNHILDMMVYNYAIYYRIDGHKIPNKHWDWLLKAGDIKRREEESRAIIEHNRRSREISRQRYGDRNFDEDDDPVLERLKRMFR